MYAIHALGKLRERDIDLKYGRVVYVGGGSTSLEERIVIKEQAEK